MRSKPSVPPERWRFGQFELDVSTRELRKNGLRVHLQEQPARILDALLERAGELVAREELRERLWPSDTFVDFERSLNAAVAKLRQVLGDSAEQPRYVETVARRGYKFVGRVEAWAPAQEHGKLPAEATMASPGRTWTPWMLAAAVLTTLLLTSSVWHFGGSNRVDSRGAEVVRFVVTPPEETRIHSVSTVSPDGRKLAFVGIDAAGHRKLWVRELASETALRLEHTDGALSPFFSPDSQNIGFFAQGKLKRIPAAGGVPKTVCDQDQGAGGTWNQDSLILFSQRGRLHRVSAAGGPATEVVRPAAAAGEVVIDAWPQFLPDGRRFIFLTKSYSGQIEPDRSGIALGSLDSDRRKLLLPSENRAALTTSGHLLFLRAGNLQAQELDLSRDRLTGEPVTIAEDLTFTGEGIAVDVKAGLPVWVAAAGFSVSSNGVLVYHSNAPRIGQLAWLDRTGKRLGVVGEPAENTQISLSPDERWAVVGIKSSKTNRRLQNLRLMNLETQILSPLSLGNGVDADPVWSPDSSKIVYGVQRPDQGKKIDIMEATLGDRSPRTFYADGNANKPEAWSPDGRVLLYRRDEQVVLALPTLGERKPAILIGTPEFRGRFRFSPDGRWLAYVSNESRRAEIYLSSYPAVKSTRQVSKDGGCTPLWRKDGRELFYMTQRGDVMAVDIRRNGSSLESGTPKILFHVSLKTKDSCMGQFGVSANGQKFLVNESPPGLDDAARMHVVMRWEAALPPPR